MTGPKGLAAVLAVLCLCHSAQAQETEPEAIPVEPLEDSEEDLAPLFSSVLWTSSANVQWDALASSDLEADRQKDGELRRARLSGLLEWHNWRMKLGLDLAEEAPIEELETPLRDLSFEYRGLPVHMEFGLFVEPFGLLQTGSRGAAFMERPQPSGIGPGYGVGFAANMRGGNWGLTGGVFGPASNDVFFGGREDAAITVRGTVVPLRFDDARMHFGLALSLREPVDGELRFVTIPESVLLLGLNTSSEQLLTDDYTLYGAEFATQWGPVLVQAEYFSAEVTSALLADDLFNNGELTFVSPNYDGHYVEAAWAVTGERRDYSTRRGTFSGIYPQTPLFAGGFGALELALRHSRTDLHDTRAGGERGQVSSVALNWYPMEYVKLMLEGLDIEEENGEGVIEEASAVQLRVQLYYSVP